MADLMEYKCPNCGGGVTFDIATQNMKCPYCDTEFDIHDVENFTKGKEAHGGASEEQGGLCVYSCNSCGGEIVGDETLGSSKCPYCDSPIVLTGQFEGEFKPDYVIPFKLDKKAAVEAFKKHLCGKKLLPKAFKSHHHLEEIKGLYVPFWVYDAMVDADISYDAAKIRTWSDDDYNYTETKIYDVEREGSIAFESIPVDGSKKMPDDMMESIEPFDIGEAVSFHRAYLAGYMADRYDMDKDACMPNMEQRVRESAENAFAETVHGYQSVHAVSSKIKLQDFDVKYALFPVWILNTTWKNEQYMFAMNGQTGKFVGNLPVDKAAARNMFLKWFGILGVGVGAVVSVLTLFV